MKVLKTSDKIGCMQSILSGVCFNRLFCKKVLLFSIHNHTVKIIKSIV